MKENRILFQIKEGKECESCDGTHSFLTQDSIENENVSTDSKQNDEDCGQSGLKTSSLWINTIDKNEEVQKNMEDLPSHTQVIVIGGGMAGVLTAYELMQKGMDVIVVEKGEGGRTCTANTTAKITSLHGGLYSKIQHAYGEEKAKKYFEAQEKAIQRYAQIIEQHQIECDFERKNHVLFTVDDQHKLDKELKCMNTLKLPIDYTRHSPLPFDILGGIVFANQAQFHPLKFIEAIAKLVPVYSHCQATRIDSDGTVQINHSKEVKAEHVVIATHYPLINSKGFYFTRIDQERSYTLALQQQGGFDIHDMYIDIKESGHSFRPYEDLLVMAGGNHRSGKKKVPHYYQELEGEATKWFPNAKIKYQWSNQDGMTIDQLPYIGTYSKAMPNFYVAAGFNQWGMSNSMVAADLISDLITDRRNEYEEVFTPNRHEISGAGNFLVNGAVSAAGLVKQLIHKKNSDLDSIKNGDAGIIREGGVSIGVYRDESGHLHAIDTKCTHLGCQLAWNPNEKTWDCPCHGSRFDIDGHLIEDPAQKDLKKACHLKNV